MKCPQCGQICRTKRDYCALCGAPLKRNYTRIVLTVILIILLLGFLVLGLCWKFFPQYYPFSIPPTEKTAPVQTPAPAPALKPAQTAAPSPEAAPVPEPAEQPETAPEPAPEAAPAQAGAASFPEDAMWPNVAQIYARDTYTLALCQDGTVKVAGQPLSPEFGFDLFNWTDIRQLLATDYFVAGLTEDGRVRLTGEVIGYEEAAQWTDVEELYYSADAIVGLTRDGKVLAVGPGLTGDPAEFHDIVRVICSRTDTLLIDKDGRANVLRGQGKLWDASGNRNIADVAANSIYAVYLLDDGNVRAGASCWYYMDAGNWGDPFTRWGDVVQLIQGDACTLGLTADGRVLCSSFLSDKPAPDTSAWSGVVQMLFDNARNIAYGVTEDGRVLTACPEGLVPGAAAWENVKELHISDNYIAGLTRDGHVLAEAWPEAPAAVDVSGWENVETLLVTNRHLVALRSDGWVLADGASESGQCGER